MGWNSWNHFACNIDETLTKQTADAMVAGGPNSLLAAGYDVLTLDDCWLAAYRNAAGDLTNDPTTFPGGMKALGDYIHARGLRYGLYISIGTRTCMGKAGSLGHEARDLATLVSWGVDYIKADRCGTDGMVLSDLYAQWRDLIRASGRPIILSASYNSAADEPWAWGPVTAHQWRMSPDISDDWTSPPGQPPWKAGMIEIFDINSPHAAATSPGHYNDPDMLEVGNGGMSETEYRTHMGLWALMSAPLIAGNDVRSMSDATRSILTNREVIAVDQDALGFQATKAGDNGLGQQVWYKPLSASGARAVGLLNRGSIAATITVDWSAIGLARGAATVRDLWALQDRGAFVDRYSASVPGHGLTLLRIIGTDVAVKEGFLSDQPWTYMANEVGPVQRDASNGGRIMMMNGVRYTKGLGAHAPSALEFRTNGTCSNFSAKLGLDDEGNGRGSVLFQVWGDGKKIYEGGVMRGTSVAETVNVSLAGVRSLRLQLVSVDTTNADIADWANARVLCTTKPNAPPQARIATSTTLTRPGDQVTFNGSGSFDLDGTIRSYKWDFGDGTGGTGITVRHAFLRSGRFHVTLTVTDDLGATGSSAVDIAVDDPPIARFSMTPASASPQIPIRFDATNSTDPDGRIISFAWHFGDGASLNGNIVTHTYLGRGSFLVRLVVTDDVGWANETSRFANIENRPPSILSAYPGTPILVGVSESMTFGVVAADSDGDVLTYFWTVDGAPANSSSSSFAFIGTTPGRHVVRVVATDGSGEASFVWQVEVRSRMTAVPRFGDFGTGGAVLGLVLFGSAIAVFLYAFRSRKWRMMVTSGPIARAADRNP
jgi:alpha-galactosidase